MKIESILIASLAVTVVCGAAIAADSGDTQKTDAASTTDLAQQIQTPIPWQETPTAGSSS